MTNTTWKVTDSDGNKQGTIEETSINVDGITVETFTAYSLADVEIYCGASFLNACATVRGERMREAE
jgi:hypothetical protein